MKPITVRIIINRPVEEVFAYYIDPANRPHWSDHVLSAGWINDKPVGVGAIFQVTLRQWGRVVRTEAWLRLIFPLIARWQAGHLVEEARNLKRTLEEG